MHHAPTTAGTKFLMDASSEERLDYFLTRAMECEEIMDVCSGQNKWGMMKLILLVNRSMT